MIHLWTLIYLAVIIASLVVRLNNLGSYTIETYYLNAFAIVTMTAGWSFFLKGKKFGTTILKTASLARMLLAFFVASLFLGFLAAYSPASPIVWEPAFSMGNPWVHIVSFMLIIIEILYLRMLKKLQLRAFDGKRHK